MAGGESKIAEGTTAEYEKKSTIPLQKFSATASRAATSQMTTHWVVSVTQFLSPFMYSAVGVALPAIGLEFNAGAVSLGLIEMIYVLAAAMLLLPIGRFSDIFGRKKLFIAGTGGMTLTTYPCR